MSQILIHFNILQSAGFSNLKKVAGLCLSLHFAFSLTRTLSRSFQRTAKKFLRFEHPTAKKFLRFYHATAKKFLWFPGLKLKRSAISRKKNFFLWTQKEVLAHALFLGSTVHVHLQTIRKTDETNKKNTVQG